MGEVKCLDCGYIDYPTSKEVYENDDADGNRGIWVWYNCCRKCGSEDVEEYFEEDLEDDD